MEQAVVRVFMVVALLRRDAGADESWSSIVSCQELCASLGMSKQEVRAMTRDCEEYVCSVEGSYMATARDLLEELLRVGWEPYLSTLAKVSLGRDPKRFFTLNKTLRGFFQGWNATGATGELLFAWPLQDTCTAWWLLAEGRDLVHRVAKDLKEPECGGYPESESWVSKFVSEAGHFFSRFQGQGQGQGQVLGQGTQCSRGFTDIVDATAPHVFATVTEVLRMVPDFRNFKNFSINMVPGLLEDALLTGCGHCNLVCGEEHVLHPRGAMSCLQGIETLDALMHTLRWMLPAELRAVGRVGFVSKIFTDVVTLCFSVPCFKTSETIRRHLRAWLGDTHREESVLDPHFSSCFVLELGTLDSDLDILGHIQRYLGDGISRLLDDAILGLWVGSGSQIFRDMRTLVNALTTSVVKFCGNWDTVLTATEAVVPAPSCTEVARRMKERWSKNRVAWIQCVAFLSSTRRAL